MKNQKIFLLFGGFASACLIVITLMTFATWKLSSDLKEMKAVQSGKQTSPFHVLTPTWKKDFDPWSKDWSPSGQLSELQKRMNEMMNSMSPGTSFFNKHGFDYSSVNPMIKMEETPEQYKIVVKVPEGQEVEVSTELKESQLSISGKVKSETKNADRGQSSRVFQNHQFSQSLYLAEPVDESGLRVEHDNNQLTITVPKT